jgi:hypothetical protein
MSDPEFDESEYHFDAIDAAMLATVPATTAPDDDLSTFLGKASISSKTSSTTTPTSSSSSSATRHIPTEVKLDPYASFYGEMPKKLTADEIAARVVKARQRIMEVTPLIQAAKELDLCFLVDCTGSMSSWIDEVKKATSRIVNEAKSMNGNRTVRVSFVRYTDVDQGSNAVSSFDFSEDVREFEKFVAGIKAEGGGDTAEDIMPGLDQVFKLKWKPHSTKVLIHIADAPCHGSAYHNGVIDSRSSDSGTSHEARLSRLAQQNVFYYFGYINKEYTDKMINVFNEYWSREFRQHQPIEQFDVKDPKSLFECVKTSISDSLTRSITSASYDKLSKIRSFKIVPNNTPDWSDSGSCHREKWKLTKYVFPEKNPSTKQYEPDVFQQPEFSLKSTGVTELISWSKHPFAQGGVRLAYRAVIDKHDTDYVLKLFKSSDDKHNSLKNYLLTCEAQTVAAFIALLFNREIGKKLGKQMQFKYLVGRVISLDKPGCSVHATIEKYVSGMKFVKFNNNAGMVFKDHPLSDQAQAFSHYSFCITKRNHLIVDIQGWVDDEKNTLLLTDPAIHSKNVNKFGETNRTGIGMREFFETHKCNHICTALGIDTQLL